MSSSAVAAAAGGGGDKGGQIQAERWLEIAERLLGVRDLMDCKRFAERALDADPLVEGADQLIAIADVLLASQRRLNNHLDWYAILQIDPSSPSNRQLSAVVRHYRRLALLLHPLDGRLEGSAYASRLVDEAWSVLSDTTKKAFYDAELDFGAAAAATDSAPQSTHPPAPAPAPEGTFWAVCNSCFHLHQYDSAYEGKSLRCPNCRKAFRGAALQTPPPIVPGADMYYCSWGFMPLGYTGAGGAQWKPFCPMFPTGNLDRQGAQSATEPPAGTDMQINVTPLSSKGKKMAAKKRVQSRF